MESADGSAKKANLTPYVKDFLRTALNIDVVTYGMFGNGFVKKTSTRPFLHPDKCSETLIVADEAHVFGDPKNDPQLLPQQSTLVGQVLRLLFLNPKAFAGIYLSTATPGAPRDMVRILSSLNPEYYTHRFPDMTADALVALAGFETLHQCMFFEKEDGRTKRLSHLLDRRKADRCQGLKDSEGGSMTGDSFIISRPVDLRNMMEGHTYYYNGNVKIRTS
jgi:hypothetical protein